MARKPIADMSAWPSLTFEGNLIAPAMIASIDRRQAAEQTEEDYRIRKGLTIREEISTAFRVGQSHFDAFAKLESPSVEATRRFVRAFLAETFGFDDFVPVDGAISFLAGGRIPIVIVPPAEEKLDRRSPTLSIDRSRSPAIALQDYLNDNDGTLWGMVTNGAVLRLMRDNASLTRPAYIEADVAQIFANEDAASFAILWSLIHRTRFGAAGAPAPDCALERWREAGSREGEAARDRLAAQVETALKALGSGFLEANPDLARRLKSGEVNLTEWFNELLRLVYRLIFLMVAEDRNLLHPDAAKLDARKLYTEGYSLTALRTQCARAATWDKHYDRFEGVKIVFRSLAHGEPALGLPALGGLFASGILPHLETARLRNRAFMEALYRLSWLKEKTGMTPVNWRAMETEELGSVYESLLELQPQLGDDGRTLRFASEAAEQKGNQRKTTGSYYTPDSLVQALLDTALDPVLDKTETEADDPATALLKLSIIDPACGSGHFLLAAARRIATRLARVRAEGTPSLADFRHALRDVARCSLYGVDRNPMAVDLTKVALWIETVDPGLPLGFFDAQIRCGDSLLGVFDLKVLEQGIPDAAYKPLIGDDRDIASIHKRANAAAKQGQGGLDFSTGINKLPESKPLALDFSGFRDLPEDTVEQIGNKAARFEELRKGQAFVRAAIACDLYIAAFLLPKLGDAPVGPSERTIPTTEELWLALNQGKLRLNMTDASKAARRANAFHWPLEFPDVMARGGFDAALGNPPWERIKLQEQEFFAARSPEIADAPNKAAREKLIKVLEKAPAGSAERALFDAFIAAKREAEAASEFARVAGEHGGRFPLTGRGDVNTYALFAELFSALARGRAGVIVPTGVATEATTAPFFAHLVERRRLAQLVDFENRGHLFSALHTKTKFCLLTLGREAPKAAFAFFLTNPAQLGEPERNFSLSPAEIAAINPNTKTAPVFRSRTDATLTAKIYANAPILIEDAKGDAGNGWGVSFTRLFDMSNDSGLFRTGAQLADAGFRRDGVGWMKGKDRYTPLYEAKMFWHFDHRWSSFDDSSGSGASPDCMQSPDVEPTTRYWIDESEVLNRISGKGWSRKWFIASRNVSDSRNERTFVAAILPFCGLGNSGSVWTIGNDDPTLAMCLLANLDSIALDFVARQKVPGMNVNYFIINQFPVLPPTFYKPDRSAFVAPRVFELTYTSHSLAPFARDLGHDGPPFAWDENRRANLRADLDAFYARAYGLTRDELRYILDPADLNGPDYPSETFRVLKEKEIDMYGEFRTRRLVLEAWDRLEADGTFASLGLADVPHSVGGPASVELPPLDALQDHSWAWPASVQLPDRLRYAAQNALWQMDPASDSSRMRFAIAAVAEPALLTPLLGARDRNKWIRLVGPEARPAQNAVRLRPAINGAWRSMFETLLTSGQLEERADGTWARGSDFSPAGLQNNSIDAQRAAFVIRAVRDLDIGSLTAAVAPEDNVIWARFGSGWSG